jgi:hypothetical protein
VRHSAPFCCAFVAIALLCASARAGISSPNSSYAFSSDGRRVLALTSPWPTDDQTPDITFPGGVTVPIRALFGRPGVYDVATFNLLWEVDGFCFLYELRWSDDFRHIVRLNRFGMREPWAVRFYNEGTLVRSYDCHDLLTRMSSRRLLPYSTWDWYSRWFERFDLNATRDRFQLTTARRQFYFCGYEINLGVQEFYEFDLATGTILSRRVEGTWRVWIYALILAAGVAVVALAVRLAWRLWRRFRAARSIDRPGFPVS